MMRGSLAETEAKNDVAELKLQWQNLNLLCSFSSFLGFLQFVEVMMS